MEKMSIALSWQLHRFLSARSRRCC